MLLYLHNITMMYVGKVRDEPSPAQGKGGSSRHLGAERANCRVGDALHVDPDQGSITVKLGVLAFWPRLHLQAGPLFCCLAVAR